MLNLDLNLASRPFKNDTLPWVGLGMAVVALTLLTVWNVRAYRQNTRWVEDLKQQYSTTRDELDRFDRRERAAQREIEGYDLAALHVRADKANEVIRWKAFSWTRLFNLLQEVLPYDVQMIGIRPIFRPQGPDRLREDPTANRVPVSVEGASKGLGPFLGFERALIAHPNFDRVEPEGHTQARTGSLAFQLQFLYDPGVDALPEEAVVAAGGDAVAGGADQAEESTSAATTGSEPPAPGADGPPGEAGEATSGDEPPPARSAEATTGQEQADGAREAPAASDGIPQEDAESGAKRPQPPRGRRRERTLGSADDKQEGGR